MQKGTGYDWLDDAFDDEKAQAEIEHARHSRNMGCLISAIAIAAAICIMGAISCSAIAFA